MELDQILQLIDKVSDSSLTAFDYEADGIKIAMEHGKADDGRSKWRDSERSSHAGEKRNGRKKYSG